MKKTNLILSTLLIAGVSMLSFVTDVQEVETFKALTEKTDLVWKGYKVGGTHTGTVKLKSGSFSISDGLIKSGEFVIDMKSIDVTDSESKKLYNHLRGEEFFNVDAFPEATLKITGSKKVEGGLEVSGNMTILSKTNPITFQAKEIGKTESFRIYTADIKIDRTKYGIVYKSSAVGDAFINDEFDISVRLTGEKVAQ